MVAPDEISMKIPSSQLLYTRLFVITALSPLRSAHKPLQALSWILEFVTVTLFVTHLKPPASSPHDQFRVVYVVSVKLLWSISTPSTVTPLPTAPPMPSWRLSWNRPPRNVQLSPAPEPLALLNPTFRFARSQPDAAALTELSSAMWIAASCVP